MRNYYQFYFITIFSILNCFSQDKSIPIENYSIYPSGVVINIENDNYTIEEIYNHFFSQKYRLNNKWSSDFGTRKNDVLISKINNSIIITNPVFNNKILVDGDKDLIDKLYKYFNKPKNIFCFADFDFGPVYGFRLIEDGITKRYRHNLGPQAITKEFGIPHIAEWEWWNVKFYTENDEEGELLFEKDGKVYSYYHMNKYLSKAVMKNIFGFTYDEDKAKESYYFIVK
ncbi:hypothetical protein [Nonlabens sp. Asnod2-A12]|uniref:hypothetical protein n=1 Tax=Nonlabens sp. Asnod2-A12 TaxID=3160578 RepID=UPI00386B0EB3